MIAWLEEERNEFGALTGLYAVFGDGDEWCYGSDLPLSDAWRLARTLCAKPVLWRPGRRNPARSANLPTGEDYPFFTESTITLMREGRKVWTTLHV